jgi:hypothetical protein
MQKRGFLFSLFLLLVPVNLFAWGQATHAYFAKAVAGGNPNFLEMYGAMVPDLFNLMTDSPDYDYLYDQTHYHYGKVTRKSLGTDLKPFAFGFATHNQRMGADRTAHLHGRTVKGGYIIGKRTSLALQIRPDLTTILENAGVPFALFVAGPAATGLAESFIEAAIDLLIKRNEDPSIGAEILQAAQDRPSSVPDLLVASYARDFARHLDLTDEEAAGLIREAEADFQQLMIGYGEILSLEEPEALQTLADQGASLIESYLAPVTGGREVDIPSETIVRFLQLAIQEVEGDYGAEVSATLDYLKHRLSSLNHRLMREE